MHIADSENKHDKSSNMKIQKTPETNYIDFIRSRCSVRRFQKIPVPKEIIDDILETAIWSPSAHNRQPWRFVVLDSHQSRTLLSDAMGKSFFQDLIEAGSDDETAIIRVNKSKERISEAPAAILVCMDMEAVDQYTDPEKQQIEINMASQSVAASIQNILLAAHALSLGAVWTGSPLYAGQIIRDTLELAQPWHPQALIFLGYPETVPQPRSRTPIQQITIYR